MAAFLSFLLISVFACLAAFISAAPISQSPTGEGESDVVTFLPRDEFESPTTVTVEAVQPDLITIPAAAGPGESEATITAIALPDDSLPAAPTVTVEVIPVTPTDALAPAPELVDPAPPSDQAVDQADSSYYATPQAIDTSNNAGGPVLAPSASSTPNQPNPAKKELKMPPVIIVTIIILTLIAAVSTIMLSKIVVQKRRLRGQPPQPQPGPYGY
ncbi:hypothetical protein ABW21_db0207325 [Orbilia brochopaga]|nr:hypothetical protein ABW21_db0207325 [Drechslerella brochopaga]